MKRTISAIMILSASALLLASCGKEPMPGKGRAKAIKLTVNGVDTKAPVVTTDSLQKQGVFKITAFATDKWEKDVVGHSGEIPAGLYTEPDGDTLKDIDVNYYSTGSASTYTQWVITGNGNGSGIETEDPAFSWINAVAMNFFAYAPVSINGTRNLSWNSVASPYTALPFEYVAKSSTSGTVSSSDCDDIIFAFASNTATYESDSTSADFGKLKSGNDYFSLKFYHALAQIRFCVDPADYTDIKLISVKLVGPKSTSSSTGYLGIASKGSCTFAGSTNTFSWNSSTFTNRYAYIQTFGTSGTTFGSTAPTGWTRSTYGTSPDVQTIYTCASDVILVIPQTLTDCGVEVTIQEGSSDPVLLQGKLPATTSSSTNVSWDAGYYYTYKIGTTGSREDLSLTMTLVDWAERESYIPIN